MAETKDKANRIVFYPGELPVRNAEEKILVKNKSRLIVLTVVLTWFALAIGIPTLVTIGNKLFAIKPVLY